MDNDIINLQNRVAYLESEVMWLKNEIKELRQDILRNAFRPTMVGSAHDDMGE